MALHRFFATAPLRDDAGRLALTVRDEHHVRDVLRLRVGDEILVVFPGGGAARVSLTDVGTDGVHGRFLAWIEARPLPRVWLVQGLAKGERMDLVVRIASEIGVERIVVLATERSVVRLEGAKVTARIERWQRVAESAAKQAQLTNIPLVTGVETIERLESALAPCGVRLVAWEEAAGAPSIREALHGTSVGADVPVAVIIGPEGGWTRSEVEALVGSGAIAVTLGDTVLRTETAGVVASALAMAARGGLGER